MGTSVRPLMYPATSLSWTGRSGMVPWTSPAVAPSTRLSRKPQRRCLTIRRWKRRASKTTSHNQSALASFKTTLGDRSMDMTRVCGTSVLEQTITSTHRTHVVSDTGMDVTVGPQDMVTGGDATVRLQQTMNMTCPVGSTSFATGASDEVDAGVVPSEEAAKGNCAIASPSGTFDIAAFVGV
ncbi:hypothetical protein MRX96_008437 [Rhipicephalus microplus]